MDFSKRYLLFAVFFLTMPSSVLADEHPDRAKEGVVEKRVVDQSAGDKAVGKIKYSSPSYGPGLLNWFKTNAQNENGKLLRRIDLPRVKLYRSKNGKSVYDLYEIKATKVASD